MATVECDVCDRIASATVIIVRWHDLNVCTDCLAHKAEIDAMEAEHCECVDCFRHAVQQQGE